MDYEKKNIRRQVSFTESEWKAIQAMIKPWGRFGFSYFISMAVRDKIEKDLKKRGE
jgi:hypothetical protein